MLPRLLVVTDRAASSRPLGATVEAAIAGGARAVVFREKDLPAGERERLAVDVAARLAEARGFLLVASDPALADRLAERYSSQLAVGVHLASADVPPAHKPGLLGRSCHDQQELERAESEAADYVTLSPVAASLSKPGYGPLLGAEGVAQAATTARVPVYALGGINATNAGELVAAGAHGVAVMGAVMGAADPRAATAAVVEAIRQAEPV